MAKVAEAADRFDGALIACVGELSFSHHISGCSDPFAWCGRAEMKEYMNACVAEKKGNDLTVEERNLISVPPPLPGPATARPPPRQRPLSPGRSLFEPGREPKKTLPAPPGLQGPGRSRHPELPSSPRQVAYKNIMSALRTAHR